VLVAGKGHEQDQQVGDLRIPMNDRATVAQALGLAA
jgi:UDP-N-acetylmuramyl tripeptide synthase